MTLYAALSCRRPIKMSLLCQIEMTRPGGFAELAYEPSALQRARSNNGSGFVGQRIGRWASAALHPGSAPAHRPTPTMVTSLSGRDGDICIWRTHSRCASSALDHKMFSVCGQEIFYGISACVRSVFRDSLSARAIEHLILPA